MTGEKRECCDYAPPKGGPCPVHDTPVPSEVAETTAGEHHPACYQSTGVPDHLPAGLCDCKVLRMLDAAENTTGEREPWSEASEETA